MPEHPRRRAVTRDNIEDADFRAALVDAIDHDPDVREAIRRLTAAVPKRQPRPTISQRGGRR